MNPTPSVGHRIDVLRPVGRFRPLVGTLDAIVTRVSAPEALLGSASEGLPAGAARAEAVAIRLRRRGVALEWAEPEELDRIGFLRLCAERGRSSVQMIRADPTLVTEMQVGAWFAADWRVRLVRRAGVSARWPLDVAATRTMGVTLTADLAFWREVRSECAAAEWRRLTQSSYVALVYHRLAGELKRGQERVDVAPRRFARHLGVLTALGFRHLAPEELLRFHESAEASLPRRAFIVTVDDGLLDTFRPLTRHASYGVQLFVPTRELGGRAHWLDGEPVMDWNHVRTLSNAGVAVGAHARQHRRLSGMARAVLDDELAGSRGDLHSELVSPLDIVAYPHGDHDEHVRNAAVSAGFRAAFTTEKGRNGAGTDRYTLRRISVHGPDGPLAVLWKVATGESLPLGWLLLRAIRQRLRRLGWTSRRNLG